ncbi:hypothetical protein PanWU01x14_317630 [Parasponia andersonii]|uniref:Uncharacterized protein n=1 Tax=Parasponia andersonii TaxID=3476 RepID=A0A2P5AML3_PARAD|nr:hypothetical protein PanWU01x14_317630 [Parasponia andersonii]
MGSNGSLEDSDVGSSQAEGVVVIFDEPPASLSERGPSVEEPTFYWQGETCLHKTTS